jgi:tRNA threonylcarbamoyladenosine biosynthesis protein TsaB
METSVEPRVLSGDACRGTLLVVDTSTDRAMVVLDLADGRPFEAPAGTSRQHGRALLASVQSLLTNAGVRPFDLSAIGVGLGPGSFTGLRIGLTAAKTLAYAVGCPLFTFDSLEAIAGNAPNEALRVVAIGDAQRGDLFAADFAREEPGGPLRRTAPTRLERADSWPATLRDGTFIVGPALGRAEPPWPPGVVRCDGAAGYPAGQRMIELVREQMMRGQPVDPWFLEPEYTRRSAAEEKAESAGRR